MYNYLQSLVLFSYGYDDGYSGQFARYHHKKHDNAARHPTFIV